MRKTNSDLNFLFYIFFVIILTFYIFHQYQSKIEEEKAINEVLLKVEKTRQERKFFDKDLINIKVNEPIQFSYKTKDEIYKLRKEAVKSSIFFTANYEPSNKVFGQIIDNKPWYSAHVYCINDKSSVDASPSEESRFILNPSVLVAIEMFGGRVYCDNGFSNLFPSSVTYLKSEKLITVTYNKLRSSLSQNAIYTFNGLNALDFGYKYAFISSSSIPDLGFIEQENISNQVVEFQNFIHLGYSCRLESGCNNGSPQQPYLDMKQDIITKEKNIEIYIKLWKERPFSSDDPADITEKIIILN